MTSVPEVRASFLHMICLFDFLTAFLLRKIEHWLMSPEEKHVNLGTIKMPVIVVHQLVLQAGSDFSKMGPL